MDAVAFRPATAADLPAMLSLLADDDVAQARGGYTAEVTPAVRAAFEEIDRDPNNELWLGSRDGEVVAMLQLTLIPGLSRGGMRRALVEAVRVRADLRGRGIGEALMALAEERARAAGCGLIQLTTDRKRLAAHRFYERIGYVASHVGMKKKLVMAQEVSRNGARRSPAERSRCAACGAPFHCGIDDAGGCWCTRLPALPRKAYAADAGCLCEACLRRALDAASPSP